MIPLKTEAKTGAREPNPERNLEARAGIEPAMQLLQSRALPLGYPAAYRSAQELRGLCLRFKTKFRSGTSGRLFDDII